MLQRNNVMNGRESHKILTILDTQHNIDELKLRPHKGISPDIHTPYIQCKGFFVFRLFASRHFNKLNSLSVLCCVVFESVVRFNFELLKCHYEFTKLFEVTQTRLRK